MTLSQSPLSTNSDMQNCPSTPIIRKEVSSVLSPPGLKRYSSIDLSIPQFEVGDLRQGLFGINATGGLFIDDAMSNDKPFHLTPRNRRAHYFLRRSNCIVVPQKRIEWKTKSHKVTNSKATNSNIFDNGCKKTNPIEFCFLPSQHDLFYPLLKRRTLLSSCPCWRLVGKQTPTLALSQPLS